jgi:hypothetical protein
MPSTLLITNEQKQLLNLQQLIMDSASRLMIQKFKSSHPNYFKNNIGKPILIVGHSNTALEIIEAAGGTKPFATIADEEYDNLFLVTIKKNGTAKVRAMKYGTKVVKN